MVVSMLDVKERIVCRVTPAQAHTWALCSGFFQAQYRAGKPFAPTYNSLLGTSVHELIVAFDRAASAANAASSAVNDLDDLVWRNWHAGRFATNDNHRALADAKTLLTAYADLRQAEAVQVLGSEVFCQTAPRTLGPGHTIVLAGASTASGSGTTVRSSCWTLKPALTCRHTTSCTMILLRQFTTSWRRNAITHKGSSWRNSRCAPADGSR